MQLGVPLAALVLAGSWASPAVQSDTGSANFVMRGCRALLSDSAPSNVDTLFSAGVCTGTIEGIGLVMTQGRLLCAPEKVTSEEVLRAITSYIDARPERSSAMCRQQLIWMRSSEP